jgi:hypothetical protein
MDGNAVGLFQGTVSCQTQHVSKVEDSSAPVRAIYPVLQIYVHSAPLNFDVQSVKTVCELRKKRCCTLLSSFCLAQRLYSAFIFLLDFTKWVSGESVF